MSGRFPYIVRYNTVFHLMRCLLRLQWVGTSPQALLCKLYELRRCESSLTTMQECLPLDTMILIISQRHKAGSIVSIGPCSMLHYYPVAWGLTSCGNFLFLSLACLIEDDKSICSAKPNSYTLTLPTL